MVPLIIIRISQIVNNVGGLSVSNVVFVFICLRFFKFIYFIFAASLPNGVVPENGLDRKCSHCNCGYCVVMLIVAVAV